MRACTAPPALGRHAHYGWPLLDYMVAQSVGS